MPPRNLAEARRLHPDLGFALYALEPRGAVTLEVLDGETSHTFVGVTEAEAWSAAFPGTAPDEPPERRVDALVGLLSSLPELRPASDLVNEPAPPAEPARAPSVFD